MERQDVIRVSELVAGYDQPVLQGVSFSVRRGEIFAILGGSGSGKSTILKHMIGLVPPLAGRIEIMGEPVTANFWHKDKTAAHCFGVAYQSGALFGSMTLLENITLPLESYTKLPPEARQLSGTMKLDLVGLKEYADYYPSEVSGGMKKRAAIARALALDPDILFLDEPSAGLDPVTSAGVDELILRLRKMQGVTIVMVTHELSSVFAVADRCIMLDRKSKSLLAEGTPEELRSNPPHEAVRLFFNRGREEKDE